MTRRILITLEALALFLCLWMFATRGHASESIDVAVLKNRADAIDHHLQTTDATVDRLWQTVNALQADMSEMHGEERVAWGVITLLCSGSIVVQLVGRKP